MLFFSQYSLSSVGRYTVQYKLYLQAASNIYRTDHEIYINSIELSWFNYVTVTQNTIKQQHEYCFKALAPTLFYTIITDKKHDMNEWCQTSCKKSVQESGHQWMNCKQPEWGLFLVCIDIIHILNSLNVCLWFQIGWVSYDDTESTLEYRMNILVSPYLKSSCGFFCTKDIFFVTCIKYFNVFHKILQLLPVTRWNLFGKLLFLHPALNYFKRFSFFGSCIKIIMAYMYFLLKPVQKVISCTCNWFLVSS